MYFESNAVNLPLTVSNCIHLWVLCKCDKIRCTKHCPAFAFDLDLEQFRAIVGLQKSSKKQSGLYWRMHVALNWKYSAHSIPSKLQKLLQELTSSPFLALYSVEEMEQFMRVYK